MNNTKTFLSSILILLSMVVFQNTTGFEHWIFNLAYWFSAGAMIIALIAMAIVGYFYTTKNLPPSLKVAEATIAKQKTFEILAWRMFSLFRWGVYFFILNMPLMAVAELMMVAGSVMIRYHSLKSQSNVAT